MKHDCESLFNMTDEARRRFQFPGARKHRAHWLRIRPKKNRQELLEYLRKNQLKTERQLKRFRTISDPNRYDYYREFGSWAKAKKEAFGKITFCEITAKYILMTILRWHLYSPGRYHAQHKLMPEVIPSLYQVYRKWGSFKKAKIALRQFAVYKTIHAYYVVWKKLGRKPTGGELQREKIYLDDAVALLGAGVIDEIVLGFLEQDAKQNGNN